MSTRENTDDRIALLQGTLDLLILKSLVFGPCHGQGIARSIQRQSEDVFLVEHGSLYVALQRLEDKNWIRARWGVSENNRKARFYSLTEKGREQLEKTSEWRRLDPGSGSDSGCESRAAIRGGMSMFSRSAPRKTLPKRSRLTSNWKPRNCGARAQRRGRPAAGKAKFGNVRAAQERFYLRSRWEWLDKLVARPAVGIPLPV